MLGHIYQFVTFKSKLSNCSCLFLFVDENRYILVICLVNGRIFYKNIRNASDSTNIRNISLIHVNNRIM